MLYFKINNKFHIHIVVENLFRQKSKQLKINAFKFNHTSDVSPQLFFFLHILSIIVEQVQPAYFFKKVFILLIHVMDFNNTS